jgi:flagellar biosynthetic protein FlhB
MDFEEGQNRTEPATPRRREEARKKGLVALSSDLSGGLLLLAGTLLLWLSGEPLGGLLLDAVQSGLLYARHAEWGSAQTARLAETLASQGLRLTGLLLIVTSLCALLVGVLQAGFHWTAQPLAPDWSRLSPTRGWTRLLSSRSIVRAVLAGLKAAVLAALAIWVLRARAGQIAVAGHGTLAQAAASGWNLTMLLALALAAAMVLVGLADYLFQRWRTEEELRMTRRELQEEHREDEGDPLLHARIRKLQREVGQRRMIRDVPKATAVITNPTHLAIALRYERGEMEAPKVVAKGQGLFARQIVKVAKEHGVPVLERKLLARALYRSVEVGQEIPMEFYQAIAEILAYVYRLRAA